MPDLPPRSAAWNDPQLQPDDEVVDRAVRATLDHPLAVQACQYPFCHTMVLLEPRDFLAGTGSPVMDGAFEALADCEHVLIVSYQTCETQPEPLSGHGVTFDFVLHPDTLAIMAVEQGTWRS